MSATKGASSPTSQSLGANRLLANVVLTQTAVVAIGLGIRDVTVPCVGAVVGERYNAYIRKNKLNAGAIVDGKPAGYSVLDCACNVKDTITVSLNAPLLAIGAAYILYTDIVNVTVSA